MTMVEISAPSRAKIRIPKKFLRKNFFFMLNPAWKMIGGRRRTVNTCEYSSGSITNFSKAKAFLTPKEMAPNTIPITMVFGEKSQTEGVKSDLIVYCPGFVQVFCVSPVPYQVVNKNFENKYSLEERDVSD